MEDETLTNELSAREQMDYAVLQKDQENYGSEINLQNNYLDVAKQGIGLFDKAMDVYRESQQIDLNCAKIQAQTDVQLANIAAKFTLCQQVLLQTFGERDKGLGKHYEVLENALASGDRELVIASLQGISSIIVQNPLESFSKMIQAWDNPKETLELDF